MIIQLYVMIIYVMMVVLLLEGEDEEEKEREEEYLPFINPNAHQTLNFTKKLQKLLKIK